MNPLYSLCIAGPVFFIGGLWLYRRVSRHLDYMHEKENAVLATKEIQGGGPSDRQVRIAKEFPGKYSQHRPEYLSRLEEFVTTEWFGTVDLIDISIVIFADDDSEDVEIGFNGEGDMGYYVTLKDWAVVDVCGVD